MITASTSIPHTDTFLDERMKRRHVIDQYHQLRMEPSIGLKYREQAEWATTTRCSTNGLVVTV
jgi:hypothetical protein